MHLCLVIDAVPALADLPEATHVFFFFTYHEGPSHGRMCIAHVVHKAHVMKNSLSNLHLNNHPPPVRQSEQKPIS